MSKLKVDEIRSADRSVSSSANITLADDGTTTISTINASSSFPTGHIIQTVVNQQATQGNTTSTSFNNKVNIDTTITPRFASSSILLTASFGHYSSGDYGIYDFYKNASDVTETYNLSGKSYGVAQASGQSKWMHTTMTYLDPLAENSTSTKTYSLVYKSANSGTTYLGWGSSSLVVFTLQEIAA